MSQQEMLPEGGQQSEAKGYNSGYEAFPNYNHEYEPMNLGQKLGGTGGYEAPEDAHLRMHRLNLRIGMAITSLVFWMIFFFVCVALLLNNQAMGGAFQFFIFMGIGVFTFLVIMGNVVINRKRI